jgi:hypothetical protein
MTAIDRLLPISTRSGLTGGERRQTAVFRLLHALFPDTFDEEEG